MKVRLSILLKPFVKPVVVILQKTRILSPKGIKVVSLYFLLVTLIIFILLVDYPYSQNFKILTIVFLLLSAFWDEVERELDRSSGYSDILVFTALFYYLWNETFLEKFIPLKYLIITWLSLIIGIIILPVFSKERFTWFACKSERNLLIFFFAMAGYTHKAFSEYLCYGFITLSITIYLSLIHSFLISRGISLRNTIYSIPKPRLPKIQLPSLPATKKEYHEHEEYEELPKYRYTVIVTKEDGSPLPNIKVEIPLRKEE